MELKTDDSTHNDMGVNDMGLNDSRSKDVDLDRLIRWVLLFSFIYFGASLVLK